MQFSYTIEEARSTAMAVAEYYRKDSMQIKAEVAPWPDAPYRPTLTATRMRSDLRVLVEAQGEFRYDGAIQEFANWLRANRRFAGLYLAAHSDSRLTARLLTETKKEGVGILIVGDSGNVEVFQEAQNPALIVTPDPTLCFGNYKKEVMDTVKKFNEVNRKDGLSDICDLVERETENLGLLGIKKGLLQKTEEVFKGMSWEQQINALAGGNNYNNGVNPIIDQILKRDLLTFKDARNLIKHKVRGKRAEEERERKFQDKMTQGPRLMHELLALQRKVRRSK